MSFDRQIASIEQDIRRLRIEFDKYMAGAVRIPPEDFRLQIGKRISRLRQSKSRSFDERFRLGTLEDSFNTLCELHGRRLRDIEGGKVPHPRRAEGRAGPDPMTGFLLGDKIDRSALQALYHKLYGDSGREAKTDFGSFEKHVDKQISKLRERTGCRRVHLRVAREGQTLKLKAKPVREEKKS